MAHPHIVPPIRPHCERPWGGLPDCGITQDHETIALIDRAVEEAGADRGAEKIEPVHTARPRLEAGPQ